MAKLVRVVLGVAVMALVIPMASVARGEEEQGLTTGKGLCTSGVTTWEIEMAREVGIGFEVGIDSGVPDQEWHVVLRYNQHVLIDTVEQTEDEGDFELRIVENNAVGRDKAQVRATNAETGEVCIGEIEAEL